MGPPSCKDCAVPKNRPVPMTPPMLVKAVISLMDARGRLGHGDAPDHSDVPIFKLPLECVLRWRIVWIDHLRLGIVVVAHRFLEHGGRGLV